jgi:hypothetical protein
MRFLARTPLVLKLFGTLLFSVEPLLSVQKLDTSGFCWCTLNNVPGLTFPHDTCYVPGPNPPPPTVPVELALLSPLPKLFLSLCLDKSISWWRSRDAVRVEMFCWWMGEWPCSKAWMSSFLREGEDERRRWIISSYS